MYLPNKNIPEALILKIEYWACLPLALADHASLAASPLVKDVGQSKALL